MGKSVLYIDDDPAWLARVSQGLNAAGYEVLTAQNSGEALPHTEGLGLGLIILDTNLAGEDSFLLMKFLKHNQPDVPVLLYSAEAHDDATVTKMLEQGADQYLRKGAVEELIVTAGSYLC
ncbi:MAG TPA: response regulator [Clostridia bacterium]|nr:response regulator [Clostridia bacterium]